MSASKSAKQPKIRVKKPRIGMQLSLGGHRNLTVLVVSLILFVAACVYFVNTVVLTTPTDDAYRSEAEAKARLITFNTSQLKQAQTFTSNESNTELPAGRTNPFGP